jgi:hypothetical protein
MPMLRTVVLYGSIGTKSVLMTVRVWLSMENLNMVSIALLTRRSRYEFPAVKVVLNRVPVWLSESSSPYTLVPLIRPLSRVGGPLV